MAVKTTEKLARFVLDTSFRSFPKEVVHQGKRCFLDLLGVALGGADQPLTRILAQTARDFGGRDQATVWGRGWKTDVLHAALVNGAMSHALDYDDTHTGVIMHPSACLVPAVLAVAEWKRLSGRSALEAYILGYEVGVRIGLGLGLRHYDLGWHSTSTLGRFASAAAAGKLLGLGLEEMSRALGLAGTQASGLRLVFGTMAKSFHPGKSASDGILSAILAKRGFTCALNILEGKKGYVEVLGVDSKLEPMVRGLGREYQVLRNTFKPYAACLLVHPTIEAVLELRRKHDLRPEEVEEIHCEVARFCLDSAGQAEPRTALAGKFSLHYCAALALAEGAAGEDKFTGQRVRDPRMVALRHRVKARVVPGFKDTEARVRITTRKGERYSAHVDQPKGDPRNPPSDRELEEKFRSLAASALPPRRIEALVNLLWDLEKVRDVREIIRLCRPRMAGT